MEDKPKEEIFDSEEEYKEIKVELAEPKIQAAEVQIQTVRELLKPVEDKVEYIPLEREIDPIETVYAEQDLKYEDVSIKVEEQRCEVQRSTVEDILQPVEYKEPQYIKLEPEYVEIEPEYIEIEPQMCEMKSVCVESQPEYVEIEPKMCEVKLDPTFAMFHPVKEEQTELIPLEAESLKPESTQIEEEELLYDSGDEKVLVDFENEIVDKSDLKGIDIVFVIESTEAMKDQIQKIRNFCRKLMRDAQNCVDKFTETNGINKFGLVLYRDYDSAYITKVFDLDSRTSTKDLLDTETDCAEGNKESAAVLKGLKEAVTKINWREESQKFIFHLLSSAPDQKELEDKENDSYLNPEEVFLSMREAEIDYTVVTFSKKLEKTVSLFTSFYECSLIHINTEN